MLKKVLDSDNQSFKSDETNLIMSFSFVITRCLRYELHAIVEGWPRIDTVATGRSYRCVSDRQNEATWRRHVVDIPANGGCFMTWSFWDGLQV